MPAARRMRPDWAIGRLPVRRRVRIVFADRPGPDWAS